jgi:Nif-specific regulatory protein
MAPSPTLERLVQRLGEQEIDLDLVLQRIIEETARQLRADRATLYLVDHARQQLVSRVSILHEITEIRLRLGEGVAGWVARSGQPVHVPRGRVDARFAARFDAATGYHTEHQLAVPIVHASGAVVGVLQVLNRAEGEFDAGDTETLEELATQVARLLEASSLEAQLVPEQQQPLAFHFNRIVGASPVMRQVYGRVTRAAATDATVLLRGETGTGKDLVARAVHFNSARADGPLVKVDCAALPENLFENELFGHERGAFTGAERRVEGKVAAAKGGTLFLDEVGELTPALQAKLLRLVQEQRYFRVGGSEAQRAEVRFLFATHRDLEQAVAAGRFRQDLYFRIRVVEIRIPPLRERGHADLDRLVDHFLHSFRQRHRRPGLVLEPAARAALHGHAWPGNVRELEHAIESAVVLTPGATIGRDLLPKALLPPPGEGLAGPERFVSGIRSLREVERAYCRHVLELCDGNRSEAARRLGIGRNTLLRKLEDSTSPPSSDHSRASPGLDGTLTGQRRRSSATR